MFKINKQFDEANSATDYYDADNSAGDDSDVLDRNCVDSSRIFGGDPFDIIAELEELSGCPLAVH